MERYEGVIKLGSGHSAILGNVPLNVGAAGLFAKDIVGSNTEMEKFGFWETSTPNYATYYPDATPEDFVPKEEEFIHPVFRMLSEVIVSKGRPIDFSNDNVLKNSMNKLIGQSVNIDHETALGNAIGSVKEVYWQKAYITSTGIKVPAGINAVLKIDAKSNPRIARGINMDPPSIHSNSVTVRFSWVPSHKYENMYEFFDALGTYHKDGQLVRCIVDNIISYTETSLVGHGADVFAQKVKEDGEIVNPGFADATYQFSADEPIKAQFNTDYKDLQNSESSDIAILSLSNSDINNKNNNQDNQTGMKKLLEELVKSFGFEADTSEENLGEAIKSKLTALKTSSETLAAEKATLETEKATLTTEKEELSNKLEAMNNAQETVTKLTTSTRAEALKYAKLAMGEVDEAITSLISGADLNVASALLKQYRSTSESKFQASCNKCGSVDVTRNSAIPSREGIVDEDDKSKGGDEGKFKANSEIKNNLINKHKQKSRFISEDND